MLPELLNAPRRIASDFNGLLVDIFGPEDEKWSAAGSENNKAAPLPTAIAVRSLLAPRVAMLKNNTSPLTCPAQDLIHLKNLAN